MNLWPNLKNLSGGLKLSRGLWLVHNGTSCSDFFSNIHSNILKVVSNVSRFKPALNLNRVLADLNRGSNSLNFISGYFIRKLALEPNFV